MNSIKRVGIAGAGVMGAGIAYCSAIAGYEVLLFDTRKEALEKGLSYILKELGKAREKGKLSEADALAAKERIRLCETAEELVADLIIEAVIEKLEVKQELFRTLEAVNGPETILATNTSSIPVTRIAAALQHPERFAGIHFFNPAHLMKLVEVIAGARTNTETLDRSRAYAESLGKTVVLAQDAPGFIVNRVARHYYVEALKIMEEDVAGFEAIDRLMEASGFRMGPFRLMDLIGVDTNYAVTESMYNLFSQDGKFRPSRIQKQKVDAGLHGRKTGEGFYRYEA
jgi:3-hydroxybutyryl-CoA dehydrogenase